MIFGWVIVSVVLLSDGSGLEVVMRKPPGYVYAVSCLVNCPRPPDEVRKHVYKVRDGKIVLDRTVIGRHTPSSMTPEKIEFGEEPPK